ncbi:hypothetical protein BJY04DRAFT_222116 [Aspergillus karnatakaensis]|uniref:uncharacterized protein n=1 Tax=Aspergillus karnatakaensis TaxID=1810916 RepID=UPI003CCCD7F2
MSCVLTPNPGFEASISGWHTSDPSIAYVTTNPNVAYAGNNFLDLSVTTENPEVSVRTYLYDLDTTTPHNLTLYVRIDEPIPSSTHCAVEAYIGKDPEAGAIASDLFWNAGQWLRLTGLFQPTQGDDVLNIVGSCAFHDGFTSNHVLIDEVVLSDCDTE